MSNGPMRVVRTIAELKQARADLEGRGTVAVVMTMGALHSGHGELLAQARQRADALIATIFVNPLQFAPHEDLARYPRPVEADLALCEQAGVDLVFMPDEEEMYPGGEALVRVTPGHLGQILEGGPRPTHFEGVLTVVAKLLHLTRPQLAFFGQKDAQQLALVRRMVADLNFDTEIVAVPIVRDEDGMAKSSRNAYLSAQERTSGLALSRAIRAATSAAEAGERAPAVLAAARRELDAEEGIAVDYLSLADASTLREVSAEHSGPAVLLVAARVGSTRLLDNAPLVLG